MGGGILLLLRSLEAAWHLAIRVACQRRPVLAEAGNVDDESATRTNRGACDGRWLPLARARLGTCDACGTITGGGTLQFLPDRHGQCLQLAFFSRFYAHTGRRGRHGTTTRGCSRTGLFSPSVSTKMRHTLPSKRSRCTASPISGNRASKPAGSNEVHLTGA